jgi:hypothetical protein
MPRSAAALRVASARPAPVITKDLLGIALEGAMKLYPFAREKKRRARIALLNALADALFNNAQIREMRDLYCEAGPPVLPGGERTKRRIAPGSEAHRAKVAEPFSKILGQQERLQLAGQILNGWEPTLS